jgi:hypothetical protein
MPLLNQKISNLLQYFGAGSRNYHLGDNPGSYDSDDRLAYYLDFSSRAVYDGLTDDSGLPIYKHRGQPTRHPVIAMLYALGNCEINRKTKNADSRQKFLTVADWLMANQDEQGGWKATVFMPKFGLRSPFYSALIQGMGISTLVRAALISNDEKFSQAAVRALKLYQVDVHGGGISRIINGFVFYEEYPSEKNYHVLNGFIYSLWGLLDLVRYNNNDPARQLWESGLATLTSILPKYDTGNWSLYHIGDGMKNPATIAYHKIHIEQLKVMHAVTGQKVFMDYAQKWQGYLENRFNALKTLPQKILWNLLRGF